MYSGKIQYKPNTFRKKSLALISMIEPLMVSYREQGFTLTVRQIFYQMVARDVLPNSEKSYNQVGDLCKKGREYGLLPWDIVDRTRQIIARPHWTGGGEILRECAKQFHMDLWATQPCRVFVIIEKDALRGVIEQTCRDYDVPLLSARGYPSASVLQSFATGPITESRESGQEVIILHLGDHDPSGLGMTDDLHERLTRYSGMDTIITRIGLTLDQVREINPPPNPAKESDTRYPAYVKRFGITDCWELDALPPDYLVRLVEEHITQHIEPDAWAKSWAEIKTVKADLLDIAHEC